jgi:phosphoglycerate dehydrogenase-like enzyme
MTDASLERMNRVGEIRWANVEREDTFPDELREARVVIAEYFNVSSDVMDAAACLEGIVVWGVGYDHVDVEAASRRGIYVVNTRGSNAESVSEQVFAFMLALSRRLVSADTFVRSGGWISREESGLPSSLLQKDLFGKTLGIIGLGAIGRRVARMAHGFEMRVRAYDPFVSPQLAQKVGVELCSLERLLKVSDFVSVNTVLNDQTRGLIGERELRWMKSTACLINTSRGAVVVESALSKALQDGVIAGAGLDVFVQEPLPLTSPLLTMDTVIVSPHFAGNSWEALESTSRVVSEEVVRIVTGELPTRLVNRARLEARGLLSSGP